MGIYRTLLEEEVPHLDNHNNPDEQIKELEEIIKDCDANEAEQDAAQAAEFGPDCGVDDIMDESAMAIYEFNLAQNAIMQSIGLSELHEASCGREFMLEGANAKAFFEKAKTAIKQFFAKVWQVLKRWSANLTATFTSTKKLISNDKTLKAMRAGYPVASAGDKKKGFTFSGLEDALSVTKQDEEIKALAKFEVSVENFIKEDFDAEKANLMMDTIRHKYCGKDCSASEFGKTLHTVVYGSESAEEIDYPSVDKVIEVLSDKKNHIDAVKKFSKGAKEEFSKSLKAINKLEGKSKSLPEGVSANLFMSNCVRANTVIRTAMSCTQTWRSVTLSAIRAQAGQMRKFAMLYIRAGNKEANPGFKKESTEFGFLGNLGLV